MTRQAQRTYERPPAVQQEVERLLSDTPSYRQLDETTQRDLRRSMEQIAAVLATRPGGGLAQQLAPATGANGPTPTNGNGTTPGNGGATATGRVGEVTRQTLNAIDFPSFVASLIQGTFQAIVDASIQQMEAYAELLKNVSMSLDTFMADNISEDTARDYIADRYSGQVQRDTSGGTPKLRMNDGPGVELNSFFTDLGFGMPSEVDDQAMDEVVVPAARREIAQMRQQTLATMVLMGINRVVVDDGEIAAKLVFHIDATEAQEMRFDQQKVTGMNMAGRAGTTGFSANGVMGNTASVNAQSDINVRADLTGEVKVRFRSETFPLERFADSAAIQLINQNAKVPERRDEAEPPQDEPRERAEAEERHPVPIPEPPPLPNAPGMAPGNGAVAAASRGLGAWAPTRSKR